MTKPTLILLPGMPHDADLWAHQLKHLSEVAVPLVIETHTADSLGALAENVLSATDGSFLLAGLSLGGYVAQEVMRRDPERVLKLALVNTNARADTEESAAQRRSAMALARDKGMGSILDASGPRSVSPTRLDDTALLARVRAMGERVGLEGYLRQQAAIMSRPDGRPFLSAIRCPTLAIAGRDDKGSSPEIMAEMTDRIPGSRLAVIEDCGHLSPIERPYAVTALLRDWIVYA